MRATAARSTPFNATQRSEVSDQCFVNSDQQHSKIVPTKYTNHTGETSFVSCNSCLPRRSFVKVGDSLAQNIRIYNSSKRASSSRMSLALSKIDCASSDELPTAVKPKRPWLPRALSM